MSKNKLKKFAEMETYTHVFQLSYNELAAGATFDLKGRWHEHFFGNTNPIVIELGCGRGEYTIGLAERFPDKNFIGIDIKGARMWTGATQARERNMRNVAFVRTGINAINHFFAPGEVAEIWITFPDPQMKKVGKRLVSTDFLRLYEQILTPDGRINLKTDSQFLFTYACAVADINHLPTHVRTDNVYATHADDDVLTIKTYYESQWLARGITIKYLQFGITHQADWQEPDIEIPFDEYRSYGRQKRSELTAGK